MGHGNGWKEIYLTLPFFFKGQLALLIVVFVLASSAIFTPLYMIMSDRGFDDLATTLTLEGVSGVDRCIAGYVQNER